MASVSQAHIWGLSMNVPEKLQCEQFWSDFFSSIDRDAFDHDRGKEICNFGAPSPLDFFFNFLQWIFPFFSRFSSAYSSKEIAPQCGENCSGGRKKRRILSRLWLSWFFQSRMEDFLVDSSDIFLLLGKGDGGSRGAGGRWGIGFLLKSPGGGIQVDTPNRCHLSNWPFNPETVHFLSSKNPFLPTMFVSKCYKTQHFGQDSLFSQEARP